MFKEAAHFASRKLLLVGAHGASEKGPEKKDGTRIDVDSRYNGLSVQLAGRKPVIIKTNGSVQPI